MDLGLKARKAFITGGNAGIGFAIARSLVQEGASVGICARDIARLNAAVEELQKENPGVTVIGIPADVTKVDELENAVNRVAKQLGGLDMVVACVGGHMGEPWLMKTTSGQWDEILRLNVVHSVDVVRAAVPYMRDYGFGSVLLIASITGWRPGPSSAYAAAKAALIHLAATLAQELGAYNIRVNALSPGSTEDTEGWIEYRKDHPEEFAKFVQEDLPLKHLVNTQQVADAAAFVLSPRGSGINGANIAADAGQYRPHAVRFPQSV